MKYKGLFGNVTGDMEEQLKTVAETADAKTDRVIALLERIASQNDEQILLLRALVSGGYQEVPSRGEGLIDIEAAMTRHPIPAVGRITKHPLSAYTEEELSDR